MSQQAIYITGYCSVSPGSIHKDGIPLFREANPGNTDAFLLSAYKYFSVDYPKFYKMDHLCKLGFLAAELLLKDKRVAQEYGAEKVGLVFCNDNASLDADLQYFESVKNIPSPAQFVYTLPNIVIGEVSIRHRCKGENAFFVQEAFDAGFLQFYVQNLFDLNRVDACICGWVECLGVAYKAVVYLVEKRGGGLTLPFDTEHIHQIFEKAHGEING